MAHLGHSESLVLFLFPQNSLSFPFKNNPSTLREEQGCKMQQRKVGGVLRYLQLVFKDVVGATMLLLSKSENIPEAGHSFFFPLSRPLLFLIRPSLSFKLHKLQPEETRFTYFPMLPGNPDNRSHSYFLGFWQKSNERNSVPVSTCQCQ